MPRNSKFGVYVERLKKDSMSHITRGEPLVKGLHSSDSEHRGSPSKHNEVLFYPGYVGKSLSDINREHNYLHKRKTGRSPQKDYYKIFQKKNGEPVKKLTSGFNNIIEAGGPITPETRISDFTPAVNYLSSYGPKPICICLHKDEYNYDPQGKKVKLFCHFHMAIDWVDSRTGKTYKLPKSVMTHFLTVLATCAGTEDSIQNSLPDIFEHMKRDPQPANKQTTVADIATLKKNVVAKTEQLKASILDVLIRFLSLFGRGALAEANKIKAESEEIKKTLMKERIQFKRITDNTPRFFRDILKKLLAAQEEDYNKKYERILSALDQEKRKMEFLETLYPLSCYAYNDYLTLRKYGVSHEDCFTILREGKKDNVKIKLEGTNLELVGTVIRRVVNKKSEIFFNHIPINNLY